MADINKDLKTVDEFTELVPQQKTSTLYDEWVKVMRGILNDEVHPLSRGIARMLFTELYHRAQKVYEANPNLNDVSINSDLMTVVRQQIQAALNGDRIGRDLMESLSEHVVNFSEIMRDIFIDQTASKDRMSDIITHYNWLDEHLFAVLLARNNPDD